MHSVQDLWQIPQRWFKFGLGFLILLLHDLNPFNKVALQPLGLSSDLFSHKILGLLHCFFYCIFCCWVDRSTLLDLCIEQVCFSVDPFIDLIHLFLNVELFCRSLLFVSVDLVFLNIGLRTGHSSLLSRKYAVWDGGRPHRILTRVEFLVVLRNTVETCGL